MRIKDKIRAPERGGDYNGKVLNFLNFLGAQYSCISANTGKIKVFFKKSFSFYHKFFNISYFQSLVYFWINGHQKYDLA